MIYNKLSTKNKYVKRNWFILECKIMTDRMRYEEILQRKFKINTSSCINCDDELPINRLFEAYHPEDCKTLTMSYEFRNMIRDQEKIYLFID